MKLRAVVLVCLLFACIRVSAQETRLKFDGYYRTLSDSLNPFSYYLRFYPDGTVIGYTTAGNPKNLVAWFNKDHSSPSKGQYKLNEKAIQFTLKSDEGLVEYNGSVPTDEKMVLLVKSLINKYEGTEEYYFLKMEGLK